MSANFHYAAYSYLDEWMSKDREFHSVLGFEEADKIGHDKGSKTLVDVATYYRVIRTLKVQSEPVRLQAAYKALSTIKKPSPQEVVGTVCDFATELKNTGYGGVALSAASKFLWMRFRDPIKIYDSLTAAYLADGRGFDYKTYESFYDAWQSNYQPNEEEIRAACEELINIKKFTLAAEIEDKELAEWTGSKWFLERVFDHYMQCDALNSGARSSAA